MREYMMIFLTLIFTLFLSCKEAGKQEGPGLPAGPVPWNTFSMGVDLSYVNEIEDFGGIYRDSGEVRDPFRILRDHGANTVRVRLWKDPQWLAGITGGKLYSDLPDVEKTIRRAKELGMAVNLNIHYSDIWADPDHQETPAAWQGLGLEELCDSVYNYTFAVLQYLQQNGLTPEMVQIGNETNAGMLYPAGKVENDNWKPFGDLLNAGIRAVRDFSATSPIKPLVIIHVAQFQNALWWIEKVTQSAQVTDFDILGISHYAKWSAVNLMFQISFIITEITRKYDKKVMIVETAYPWTIENADQYANIWGTGDSVPGFPLTPEGQSDYLITLTQAVIDGGGTGIMYWEPAWITSSMKDLWGTGSSWDNCTLFDFTGDALTSMNYMNHSYTF